MRKAQQEYQEALDIRKAKIKRAVAEEEAEAEAKEEHGAEKAEKTVRFSDVLKNKSPKRATPPQKKAKKKKATMDEIATGILAAQKESDQSQGERSEAGLKRSQQGLEARAEKIKKKYTWEEVQAAILAANKAWKEGDEWNQTRTIPTHEEIVKEMWDSAHESESDSGNLVRNFLNMIEVEKEQEECEENEDDDDWKAEFDDGESDN